ncbi:MAG TPA: hypothetical protein VLK84_28540, partial [Longimicrobium sp.]|nr:hypothetical protein [Longimicrobium sp.]
MNCIHCGTSTRRKERTGGRCPKCGHAFAFEPTTNPYKLTDLVFKGAIGRVSADGALSYTPRQLFYALNRVRRKGRRFGPPKVWWWTDGDTRPAAIRPVPPGMSFELHFLPYLQRWTEVHGAPRGLLPPLAPLAPDAPVREVPPDVAAFSFDRAVVTDR